MNDHFVQSEIEYRRQQRITAATDYRRARSARHVRSLRSRVGSMVEHLLPGHTRRQQSRPVAGRGTGPAHAA